MAELVISSSALILALLLLRAIFRAKISRRLQYGLWLLVLARLLIPVSFGQSAASAANLVRSEANGTVYAAPVYRGLPKSGVTVTSGNPAGAGSLGYAAPEGGGMTRYAVKWAVPDLLSVVWKIGMGLVALWFLTINALFARRLRRTRARLDRACPLPVYTAERLPSPCLFGLFQPAVYVTPEAAADPAALEHILLHETTHYRHADHLWALLRAVCLVIWWWNPLVWVAASVSRRDCELACDESVVRALGAENRVAYGQTLLRLVAGRQRPASVLYTATTMSGSGRQLKARIEAITRRVKPHKFAVFAALVLAAAAVGCTFTGAVGSGGTALSKSLEAAVKQALTQEDSPAAETQIRVESHAVLGTAQDGGNVTVYAMALRVTYGLDENGDLEEKDGVHSAVALTFAGNDESGYTLARFWIPEDGTAYAPSIRKKFPKKLWKAAMDTQSYIDAQQADCRQQAEAWREARDASSAGIIGGADGPTQVFVTGADSRDYETLFHRLAADPDNADLRGQLLDGGQATALWCFRYLIDHPGCLDGLKDGDRSEPALVLQTAAELLGRGDPPAAAGIPVEQWDACVRYARETYPAGSSLPEDSGQQLYYDLARMLDGNGASQTAAAEGGVTHLTDGDLVTSDGVTLGMDYDTTLALTGTPDEAYADQDGTKSFKKDHVLYGFYADGKGVYRLLGYSSDTKSGVMPLGIEIGDSLKDVLAIFGAEDTPLRQWAQETIYGTPGEMDSAILAYNTDLGSYLLTMFAQNSGLTVSFDRSGKVWTIDCWSNRINQPDDLAWDFLADPRYQEATALGTAAAGDGADDLTGVVVYTLPGDGNSFGVAFERGGVFNPVGLGATDGAPYLEYQSGSLAYAGNGTATLTAYNERSKLLEDYSVSFSVQGGDAKFKVSSSEHR